MANDDLHPILRDIQQKIVSVRDDLKTIIGKIDGVQETIQNGVEQILEAINDNIQAQAELKLMDKVASVRAIPAHIEAEREQVEAEKRELEAKLDSIGDRYADRHRELDEKATERIRDLGSHIFEIQEDEYEDSIEEPFHDHVTETWQQMQLDNAEIGRDRIDDIETELQATHDSIDELLERRERFLTDIRESRVQSESNFGSPRQVQVPFWTVVVERDGERHREVYAPADLTRDSDEWYRIGLRERDAFEPLVEPLATAEPPATATTTTLSASAVESVVSQHVANDVAGQKDFADVVGDALGDGVKITVEGGEKA